METIKTNIGRITKKELETIESYAEGMGLESYELPSYEVKDLIEDIRTPILTYKNKSIKGLEGLK